MQRGVFRVGLGLLLFMFVGTIWEFLFLPKNRRRTRAIDCLFGYKITIQPTFLRSRMCLRNSALNTGIFAYIKSVPKEKILRSAVRSSWARRCRELNISVVFVMGMPEKSDSLEPEELRKEHAGYNDILQFSFVDTYYAGTLRVGLLLQWHSMTIKKCENASFLHIVVDRDSVFYPDAAIQLIKELNLHNRSRTLYGFRINRGPVYRSPHHKLSVSRELWPDDHYLPYISFIGVINSFDAAADMAAYICKQKKTWIEQFHIDDVVFNGLFAREYNYKLLHSKHIGTSIGAKCLSPCFLKHVHWRSGAIFETELTAKMNETFLFDSNNGSVATENV